MVKTAPVRRTQEERKAESERKIIRAAIRIFAKQGYLRTTLNEVGKEAGYTGGLISHRFGSKAGLLQAVIKHIGTRFMEDQIGDAVTQKSAQESLQNYIEIYLSEVTLREGTLRALYVIMGEALGGAQEIQAAVAQFNEDARNAMAKIISRGIEQGEFSADVNPNAAAVLITGMLRGVVMQYLFDHNAFNVEKDLPLIQRAAIGGLK